MFQRSGAFEQIAQELRSSYTLKKTVTLRARACGGDPNAYYDSDEVEVIFCYELMDDLLNLIASDLPEDTVSSDHVGRTGSRVYGLTGTAKPSIIVSSPTSAAITAASCPGTMMIVGLGGVEIADAGELGEDRVAILAEHELRNEPRPRTNLLDVAEAPADVADEQELAAVGALDVDHLAAGRMAGCLDQDDARRDRAIVLVLERRHLGEDAGRHREAAVAPGRRDLLAGQLQPAAQEIGIGIGQDAAEMIGMLVGDEDLRGVRHRGVHPRIGVGMERAAEGRARPSRRARCR